MTAWTYLLSSINAHDGRTCGAMKPGNAACGMPAKYQFTASRSGEQRVEWRCLPCACLTAARCGIDFPPVVKAKA
jgi:hypothetical protein